MEESTEFQSRIQHIGKQIFSHMEVEKPVIWSPGWWKSRLLEQCFRNEEFKTQVLRFIDVYPVLKGPESTTRHLQEYLGEAHLTALVKGLSLLESCRAEVLPAKMIHSAIERLARYFICGSSVNNLVGTVRSLQHRGLLFTVDFLGEEVASEVEADRYMRDYLDLLEELSSSLEGDPGLSVSLKLSSLFSQFDPVNPRGTAEAVKKRLRKIFSAAQSCNASVTLDAETYESLGITTGVLTELLEERAFESFSAGIGIQAYLKDSEQRIRSLIDWAESRRHPLLIRLVKGAYWDYEIIKARRVGWPVPVFTRKWESDANFEKLSRLLLQHNDYIVPAFASHNVRSLSHAIAAAEELDARNFEFQLLYGMGEPLAEPLVKMGVSTRLYIPYGELIPGMGYLVRRILENSANESFLRALETGSIGKSPAEDLLKPPQDASSERSSRVSFKRADTDASREPFTNEPILDFSVEENRDLVSRALKDVKNFLGKDHPLLIDGKEVRAHRRFESINPSDRSEVIGSISRGEPAHVDRAVDAAQRAFRHWRRVKPEQRAQVLFEVAGRMRREKAFLIALMMKESGKIRREADVDVCEAVDFLEYYGREALRLGKTIETQKILGEINEVEMIPRGPAAVISPWNFPLSIATGMTSAAIVTGNTVILKPSSQTPVMASVLTRLFRESGLPDGVLNTLPGMGDEIGEALLRRPEVALVAFTGSKEVGLGLIRNASQLCPGQRTIRKVIAELGGKNAIIIDESGDPDQAVIGVTQSAFGYSGQKCSAASRVIVLDSIYDQILERIVERSRSLAVGAAEDPGTTIGPVISREQLDRIQTYVELGRREAKPALDAPAPELNGNFVGPVVFYDVSPMARIAQEEIFGPVLSILRAKDFDQAMAMANDTEYALTAGLYSRTPSHIRRFRHEVEAGNRYINTKITGAVVERQPFGGYKLSGTGSKAGGAHYLTQFMIPISLTENVTRHGFAPLSAEEIE